MKIILWHFSFLVLSFNSSGCMRGGEKRLGPWLREPRNLTRTLSKELPVRVDSDVEAGHHGVLAGGPEQPRLWLAAPVVGEDRRQRRHRIGHLPYLVNVLPVR